MKYSFVYSNDDIKFALYLWQPYCLHYPPHTRTMLRRILVQGWFLTTWIENGFMKSNNIFYELKWPDMNDRLWVGIACANGSQLPKCHCTGRGRDDWGKGFGGQKLDEVIVFDEIFCDSYVYTDVELSNLISSFLPSFFIIYNSIQNLFTKIPFSLLYVHQCCVKWVLTYLPLSWKSDSGDTVCKKCE